MNAKEMQSAIESLISGLGGVNMALDQLRAVNNEQTLENTRITEICTIQRVTMGDMIVSMEKLSRENVELMQSVQDLEAHRAMVDVQLEDLSAKVNGRNKSAATKRNMTEADAHRVMIGDLKELAHKDAAEQIGLTYAQVYSCRGEFTFKDVHKELRETGWKNPWAK